MRQSYVSSEEAAEIAKRVMSRYAALVERFDRTVRRYGNCPAEVTIPSLDHVVRMYSNEALRVRVLRGVDINDAWSLYIEHTVDEVSEPVVLGGRVDLPGEPPIAGVQVEFCGKQALWVGVGRWKYRPPPIGWVACVRCNIGMRRIDGYRVMHCDTGDYLHVVIQNDGVECTLSGLELGPDGA